MSSRRRSKGAPDTGTAKLGRTSIWARSEPRLRQRVRAGGGNGSSGPNGPGAMPPPAEMVPLAVVAVAAGDGLARIFDSYGVAAVVDGGQSNNPSTGELLDAVEKVAADEILLLPNNSNVVLAARQATEMTNRRVRVVPTRNAAEGFAALLALDPGRDATTNAEVMTLAGTGSPDVSGHGSRPRRHDRRAQGQEGPDHRARS
jgi:hypothetical protein